MSQNVQETRRLTPKQRRALDALLSGATVGHASGAAGVTTRTLARWRLQPDFSHELRRRTTQAVGDATRRLAGSLDVAVDVLRLVMLDATEPAAVRVRAAKVALDTGLRLMELTEVLERLETLERKVGV